MEVGATFLLFAISLAVLAVVVLFKMVRIVPQQEAFVVERLGRFHRSLEAGLHITIPFIDVVRYRQYLKEMVLDIPEQICITKDNVQVAIDGVLFYRLIDPQRASYGVSNFEFAIIQLAQTTLRSEIGKIDLDRTFEERERINSAVVIALDNATDPWGVKVLRYEIKAIQPPKDILAAMEKQMRAEREKRAKILESEGDRDSKINRAEGVKQETIKNSEADRQKLINEAQGQAAAIASIATATAQGIVEVSRALAGPGGSEAARLRVAEQYVKEFGTFASQAKAIVVPASASDMSAMLASAFSVFEGVKREPQRNSTPNPNA